MIRSLINDPSRSRIDRNAIKAYLSKIFDWWRDDFVRRAGSVQRFVAHYVDDPDLAKDLSIVPDTFEYFEYDWNLNGVPPGKDGDAGPPS